MYVELHGRSAFSFLQGACLPEEYAETVAKLELPAMALIDRDGVYGSPRFHLAMKKLGLRGHVGAEVLGSDGARYPLLVKNRTGYQNLCRLITRTKLRTKKHPKTGREAAATPEELAEFSQGLLCLTGDGFAPALRMLLGPEFGPGDEPAKVLIPGAILHEQRIARAVSPQHFRADMPAQSEFLHPQMESGRTINTIPVNKRHRGQFELGDRFCIFFRQTSPL